MMDWVSAFGKGMDVANVVTADSGDTSGGWGFDANPTSSSLDMGRGEDKFVLVL
jgi:hypothetical protein